MVVRKVSMCDYFSFRENAIQLRHTGNTYQYIIVYVCRLHFKPLQTKTILKQKKMFLRSMAFPISSPDGILEPETLKWQQAAPKLCFNSRQKQVTNNYHLELPTVFSNKSSSFDLKR